MQLRCTLRPVRCLPSCSACVRSALPSVKQTHGPTALHKSTVWQITSRGEKFKPWCNLVATFSVSTLHCCWLEEIQAGHKWCLRGVISVVFFRSLRGRGRLKNESQSLILPWWSSWATVHCALTTKHSKQTGSNSNNIKHRELSLTARDHYSVSPHLLWPHFVAQPDRIINPIHAALCSCKEDQCWVHWSPCTRHCRCSAFIWK